MTDKRKYFKSYDIGWTDRDGNHITLSADSLSKANQILIDELEEDYPGMNFEDCDFAVITAFTCWMEDGKVQTDTDEAVHIYFIYRED